MELLWGHDPREGSAQLREVPHADAHTGAVGETPYGGRDPREECAELAAGPHAGTSTGTAGGATYGATTRVMAAPTWARRRHANAPLAP